MNATTNTTPRYEILVRAAFMPASCWGRYYRVGLVELESDFPAGVEPKMLSSRAKGVKRVVRTWERCHHGRTERCALGRALAEAKALKAELEASEG